MAPPTRVTPRPPAAARGEPQRPLPTESVRFADLLRQRRSPEASTGAPKGLTADAKDPADAEAPNEVTVPPVAPAAAPPRRVGGGGSADGGADPARPDERDRRKVGGAQEPGQDRPGADRLGALARTIARFCNDAAASDGDRWEVTIPLRPDVLPETTLNLGVSPYSLSLRFSIGDPVSRDLVWRHKDELATMLGKSLHRQRDLSIDID
jgi:hypothetical protein